MNEPLNTLRHHVTGAIKRGTAEAIVENRTPFQSELFKAIAAYIRAAKLEGTVGMSVDNLRQCVRPPSESLVGAPRGTNARYYYAQMFRETCERGIRESSNFRNFVRL